MKINKIIIQNIQSHPFSTLRLSPGLNVIRGQSDSGKSVIIRALKWLITNRASKRIRRKGIDSDLISVVEVTDGETTVSRARSDSFNGYYVKSEGAEPVEFNPVGKDIPDLVSRTLNLTEVNIQEQKDTFFLLDESAGNVAKTLNKVSGLSDIDNTIQSVNSKIKSMAAEIRGINGNITTVKTKLEETKWSLSAEKELEIVKEIHREYLDAFDTKKQLESLIHSYTHYKNQLDKFLPEGIITAYKEASYLYMEIVSLENEKKSIENLVESHETLVEKSSKINVLDISEIKKDFDSIEEIEANIKELNSIVRTFEDLQAKHEVMDIRVKATEKQLGQFKLCPSCKRPL